MEPGTLRHRITIEAPTLAQGTGGAEVTTWAAAPGFESIQAEVLPDRAGEFFGAAQLQGTTNALIRLRWQPGITTKMRVRHEVRPGLIDYWGIEGFIDLQTRGTELRLFCLKRDAEGWRRGEDLVNA